MVVREQKQHALTRTDAEAHQESGDLLRATLELRIGEREIALLDRDLVGIEHGRPPRELAEVDGVEAHAPASSERSLCVRSSQPFSVTSTSSSSFITPAPGTAIPGSMQIVTPGSSSACSLARSGHSNEVASPIPCPIRCASENPAPSAARAAALCTKTQGVPGRTASSAASYEPRTASQTRRCSAFVFWSTKVRVASAW